jgi:hypothetical protein
MPAKDRMVISLNTKDKADSLITFGSLPNIYYYNNMNRLHTMNFVEKLFIQSIDHMKTDNWEWPDKWDNNRIRLFLNESLEYAEELELYEQCAIIRDVQKTIE